MNKEKGNILMRNVGAALSRKHLEMLLNHRDSEILTTEPPGSAPLRLLLCWDPPMPTLLLLSDQGSGALEGQREGSGLGERTLSHLCPPWVWEAEDRWGCSSHCRKAALLRTPSSYTDFKSVAMRLDSPLS